MDSLRRITAAARTSRLSSLVQRQLVRSTQLPILRKLLNRWYPTPIAFFNRFGFFPPSPRQVSYKEFQHQDEHPVRQFAAAEIPNGVNEGREGDWARWTSQLPAHLQSRPLASCHTVFIPQGWASANGIVLSQAGHPVIGASLPHRHDGQPHACPSTIFPTVYRGRTVAPLVSSLQGCYFHWLFDVLPRLKILERYPQVDHVYIEAKHRFQTDALRLFGVRPDQIVNAANYDFATADTLVVPYHEIGSGLQYPEWACNFLRETLIPKAERLDGGRRPRRIYISREKARWRKVENEDEVLERLAPLGFEKVHLEELSLLEQVRLFHDAEALVGSHGSGFANLIFATPGATVIEFQPLKLQDVYFRLCRRVGVEYWYIKSSIGPENPINNRQQVHVDIHELDRTLKLAALA